MDLRSGTDTRRSFFFALRCPFLLSSCSLSSPKYSSFLFPLPAVKLHVTLLSSIILLILWKWWMPHPQRCSRSAWVGALGAWVAGGAMGLELDDLQGPFQPRPFYDSMILQIYSSGSFSLLVWLVHFLVSKQSVGNSQYFLLINVFFFLLSYSSPSRFNQNANWLILEMNAGRGHWIKLQKMWVPLSCTVRNVGQELLGTP